MPLNEPLTALLRRSVGVEEQLRRVLERPDVRAAAIHGSWAGGALRRAVRPIGKSAGRTIDMTVLSDEEFRDLAARGSSFARSVLDGPTTPLVGDLTSGAAR